jgi:predicted nucleic acid-binding protein
MYCLDTGIIIQALKNESGSLVERIKMGFLESQVYTTAVSTFELYYYSQKYEANKLLEQRKNFLKLITILNFDEKSAQIAASLQNTLELNNVEVDILDLQIASICLAKDAILVTDKPENYKEIKGLKIENWA